jgi:hypothetical protein
METVDSSIVKLEVLKFDPLKSEVLEDEEVVFERERRLRQQRQDEEDKEALAKIRERKLRQNIQSLREESIKIVYDKNIEIQKQIDVLTAEQDKHKKEIFNILKGDRDDEILADKLSLISFNIL